MLIRSLVRSISHLISIIILLSHCTSTFANPLQYSTNSYSFKQGLAETNIYSLATDKEGFTWLGTSSGLFRFDHYQFEYFSANPATESFMPVEFTDASNIMIDSNGQIWVGTWGQGLYVYDSKMNLIQKFIHSPDNESDIGSNHIQTIFEDSQGLIWIGTFDAGLTSYNPNTSQLHHYRNTKTNPNTITHNRIWSINQTSDNHLWFGTSAGLNRLDNTSGKILQKRGADTIRSIYPQSADKLWLGTSLGLFILDTTTVSLSAVKLPENKELSGVNVIKADDEGNLWLGSKFGLYRYEPEKQKFSQFAGKDNYRLFPTVDVRALKVVSTDLVLLGSRFSGLLKLNITNDSHQAINTYYDINHQVRQFKGIRSLHVDRNDSLWIGTSKGLFYREKNRVHRFNAFGNGGKHMVTIQSTQDNTLWLNLGGALRSVPTDRKRVINIEYDFFKTKPTFYNTIHVDQQNNLWLYTSPQGLVNTTKPAALSKAHQQSILAGLAVNTFMVDKSGYRWIGTKNNGLYLLNPENKLIANYLSDKNRNDSLGSNWINHILQASDDTIWIATSHTLNKIKSTTGTFERIGTKQGLISNNITSLLEDNVGDIWLGTDTGISRYKIKEKRAINLTTDDGLLQHNFYPAAAVKDAQGKLYFGGIQGVDVISPAHIKENEHQPNVVITHVWVDDKRIEQYQFNEATPLILPYTTQKIVIQYSGLVPKYPEKNQYFHRLKGYEQSWQNGGHIHRTLLSNLRAGNYVFEVKALNSSGIASVQTAELPIIIAPPFYQIWWVQLLFAITVILTSYLLYWTKTRYLLQQKLKLEQQVKTRTHELVHAEKMASLGTLTAGVAHEINNPVNFINCSSYNLDSDLHKLQKYIFALAGTDAEASLLEELRAKFTPLFKQLLIIKEGSEQINNIVKDLRAFTQYESAQIKLTNIADCLHSTVNLIRTNFAGTAEFVENYQTQQQILCYPAQLNQAFMNLMINAVDAIIKKQRQQKLQTKGKISIQCAKVAQHIEVTIQDNGCGMNENTKNQLFEPFYTTKDVGEGTGLGLSITYEIVQAHQGKLSVTSALAVGSTFKLLLPVNPNNTGQ